MMKTFLAVLGLCFICQGLSFAQDDFDQAGNANDTYSPMQPGQYEEPNSILPKKGASADLDNPMPEREYDDFNTPPQMDSADYQDAGDASDYYYEE